MSTSLKNINWAPFERWARRFKTVSHAKIDKLFKEDFIEPEDWLFLQKRNEIGHANGFDCDIDESELRRRVRAKANFLRQYFANVSFDGDIFFDRCLKVLPHQYASRCNNCIGVWLERDLEKLHLNMYQEISNFDVSFFCKSLEDVDLSSMRAVLPFDTIFIKLPKELKWTKKTATKVKKQIEKDLQFDQNISIDFDFYESTVLFFTVTDI